MCFYSPTKQTPSTLPLVRSAILSWVAFIPYGNKYAMVLTGQNIQVVSAAAIAEPRCLCILVTAALYRNVDFIVW